MEMLRRRCALRSNDYTEALVEHLDVLVVGAGLSGIAAGYYLQAKCPGRSYAIVERRSTLGGTWDLFRYPGVRSDSEMFTLGYSFNPWRDPKAIVDGQTILAYLRDTAHSFGVDRCIRYGWEVCGAEWSSDEARWTVQLRESSTGALRQMSCTFLLVCTGYYRYDRGYTPEFEGLERFCGRIVHPQQWSEDVDYSHKKVVVIGSGATAITLVPALAKRAAHVTMLQRSPSYVVPLPATDRVATRIHRALPAPLAGSVNRWRNIALSSFFVWYCSKKPEQVRKRLLSIAIRKVGAETVREHFSPSYFPWEQRLCVAPDGDLFKAVRGGNVSIVTDSIRSFTETGILLKSGAEVAADLVVTATGLRLELMGNVSLKVDGESVDPADALTYRGAMLSGIPNLALCLGYAKASWTLKCELICQYACRLINHMDRKGYRQCRPQADPAGAVAPWLDLESGYIRRAVHRFPKQGSRAPWRAFQNYGADWIGLRMGSLEDGVLSFS